MALGAALCDRSASPDSSPLHWILLTPPTTATMLKLLPLLARLDSTALKQPKELFSYSRTIDGDWNLDEAESKSSALNYFYFPDAYVDQRLDLQAGIKTFKQIPEADNRAQFPVFLAAIQQHEQATGKKTKTDIITFRGIMTKLLTLPYNMNSGFQLYVIGYDGQLFIKNDDAFDAAAREKEDADITPDQQRYRDVCGYGGYKFETLVTLPKPWAQCSRSSIEKRHKRVVNNYEQYISVVRTGIGKVKTLLAGEVDCVWDYAPAEENVLPHYVELKTSRTIATPAHAMTFERKLFRTWAQCFLLGITKIVYGFRDEQHMLTDVEIYNTDEVPVMLKDNVLPRGQTAKVVCVEALKWYGAVLEWLQANVDATDELTAYKVTYDPGSRTFLLTECVGDDNRRLRNGDILTDEFKGWREQLRR